jgi:hypothetical protein
MQLMVGALGQVVPARPLEGLEVRLVMSIWPSPIENCGYLGMVSLLAHHLHACCHTLWLERLSAI